MISYKFLIGIIMIGLGIMFYFLEMKYYNYIDENNVLQESLFLPLSFIFCLIGVFFLFLTGITKTIQRIKSK